MKNIITFIALTSLLFGCGGGDNDDNKFSCSDFSSQAAAQAAYINGATYLDADNDGIACEHLK